MVLRIAFFAMFVGLACAATWMGYEPMKPKEFAHKKGCYVEEINDVIGYGEDISPIGKGCYRIECSRGRINYASCGLVQTEDTKCFITETDLRKPYPDCCPDVRCEIDNNIVDFEIQSNNNFED